ncbi:Aminomethyltransferase folate-binding domain-containing protein [Biscogniauxia mediterranea]|nr:Aminomethyltransferase folate-binding domain-containing protein [Biscogniauxia mediterranea]
MQVVPRIVPTRALASSNGLLGSTNTTTTTTTTAATTNVRRYAASSHSNRSPNRDAQAPFVCPSCRRFRSQFRALPRQPPSPLLRRSFSAATHATTTTTTTTTNIPSPPSPPAPAAPAPSGYARLATRSLISISGADAPRFLQGIITSSITEPTDHRNSRAAAAEGTPRTRGFYTGFLNATGRVLHDVFVYPDTLGVAGGENDPAHAFLIEVDAAQRDALLRHLKRYKLRSRIALRAVEEGECAVWQAWGTEEDDLGTVPNHNLITLLDPRAPGMGYRILGTGDVVDVDMVAGRQQQQLARCDEAAYRVRRYLLGVPEGQTEIPREQALPLEANLDIMGGIDFRKGCYVGQELTIRTRHRGVVRKRVLPCMLYDYHHHNQPAAASPATSSSAEIGGEGKGGEGTPPPPPLQLEYRPSDTQIRAEHIPPGLSIGREGKKGRSAGTWLAGVGNVGLALCRLQIMTDVELPGEPPAPAPAPAPSSSHDDDPASQRREFVMRLDDGGGGDEDGVGAGPTVKVKAFVPEWVRERLRG